MRERPHFSSSVILSIRPSMMPLIIQNLFFLITMICPNSSVLAPACETCQSSPCRPGTRQQSNIHLYDDSAVEHHVKNDTTYLYVSIQNSPSFIPSGLTWPLCSFWRNTRAPRAKPAARAAGVCGRWTGCPSKPSINCQEMKIPRITAMCLTVIRHFPSRHNLRRRQ